MISALTTNVSGFFREPHHFDYLTQNTFPRLKRKIEQGQSVRIWSAGCSNGQEPYSIAMHLCNNDKAFMTDNCKILATDIDEKVLQYAMQGIYEANQLTGVDNSNKSKYFSIRRSANEEAYELSPVIKKMISFRRLNLNDEWPMRGVFDIIFCRNVVIYFDCEAQENLWPRFRSKMTDDGVIFVGHSERISSPEFQLIGATAYSKSTLDNTTSNRRRGRRNGIA
jgi:chemotaxis protein methyltransferase CheR